MKNKIVVLTGMSASGKDSVARVLEEELGYKFVVSTTTRPMRVGEVNGVNYHFKTKEEFQQLIDNDELIEYRYYDTINNGKPDRWHYGIERKSINLDKYNYVVVVDLKGLSDLKKEFGDRIVSFFIEVDYESRKNRAIARDRNFELEEFKRRYKDDVVKFKNVSEKVDYVTKNNNFDECVEEIKSKLNSCKGCINCNCK